MTNMVHQTWYTNGDQMIVHCLRLRAVHVVSRESKQLCAVQGSMMPQEDHKCCCLDLRGDCPARHNLSSSTVDHECGTSCEPPELDLHICHYHKPGPYFAWHSERLLLTLKQKEGFKA